MEVDSFEIGVVWFPLLGTKQFDERDNPMSTQRAGDRPRWAHHGNIVLAQDELGETGQRVPISFIPILEIIEHVSNNTWVSCYFTII